LQNQSNELTTQQETLKQTNIALERQALELEEKAKLLEEQNTKVEVKNREVEQARKSLEEKAEQLALLSKYKSEFLANMSHELRTPLNSLLLLSKVLSENKETNLTDKQMEYVRTIYSSGTDLMKLINEVLDLAKVEAGKMEFEPRELITAEITDYVRRSFEPLAEQKNLEFTVEMAAGVPAEIHADQQRLEQVLKNLLANAFKFTESGSVRFRIDMAPPGKHFESESLKIAGKVIAISVTDTGIGIPKNKQRLIFEPFQQADGSTSRKYGGTGLGLSISREIADALGGEIQVLSNPGEGSTFTLYLPIRYQAGAAIPTARLETQVEPVRLETPAREISTGRPSSSPATVEPKPDYALAGKTVLIVDDDTRNIFAITSLLEAEGMKVLAAENGRNGIDMIEQHPEIDIVLMDIMMPDMDGYETMKLIRNDPKKRYLPVIAVTAKALKTDRERAMTAGASDYLSKPVDESQLVDLIGIWASGSRPQAL
jgi:signal transduction histidine kinase